MPPDHDSPCPGLAAVERDLLNFRGESERQITRLDAEDEKLGAEMKEVAEKVYSKIDTVNTNLTGILVGNEKTRGELKTSNQKHFIMILISVILLLVALLMNFFKAPGQVTVNQEGTKTEAVR